jgi:hypothetical protein
VVGTCKSGNEPSGSIKCGEFLDQLRNSSRRTLLYEVNKKCVCVCAHVCVLKYVADGLFTDHCYMCLIL